MGEHAIQDAIRELAEPVIASHGLELVDIEFCSEASGWILRFYIDKEGGVSLEHCKCLSEELGDIIEVKDLIPHRYTLEVSSPGVNRPLKKESDFVRHCGKTIKLKTSQPIDGRRHFQGTLTSCRDGSIVVTIEGKQYNVPIPLISKASIVYPFPELSKKGMKQR